MKLHAPSGDSVAAAMGSFCRPLAAMLTAVLLAGLLGACSAPQPPDITVTLAHGLTVTVRGGAPNISGETRPASVTASLVRRLPVKLLGPAEQVTIAGKLPAGGAILTWRINPKTFSSGITPFVASLDQATGQWTALPGSYNRKLGVISTRISADPVVAPFGWIGSQIASMLQGALLSVFGLSGTGVYPQCSSYDVPISDSHPAEASIGFCAQPAGSSQVLVKLASMRPYPVDVTYPAGTSVSPGVLSRIIAPGSGRVILAGLDHIDAVLPLKPGNSTEVTVRLDGPAMAAGLVSVAETLASQLGGKPKAILDAFENTKCFADAMGVLDSVTDPTRRDSQDIGSTILECAGQALEDSKNVAAIVGAAVIFAASLAGDAIFTAWGTIDKLNHTSDHVLTVNRASAASVLGRWYAHDGEICIGQALDLSAYTGTGDAPCSGSSTSGWERSWGCSYISLSPPRCGFAWVPLSFAYQAGGRVIATASTTNGSGRATTICTATGSGQVVPCGGLSPEGIVPVTQTLSLVKAGVLKVAMPPGYFGGFTSDWCSPSASQADQQHYCPNG